MSLKASRISAGVFIAGVCVAALAALSRYPGRGAAYLGFSIVFNGLLFAGFRKKRLFFDTFLGIFLWLGFWFKLSAMLILRKPGSKPPLWRVTVVGAQGEPDITTEDKLLDVALRRVSSELSKRMKS